MCARASRHLAVGARLVRARRVVRSLLVGATLLAAAARAQQPAALPDRIEFNRDVRPILSDKCFYCHGPDASHRKGKLRLDVREAALDRDAFVPGRPAESTLIEKILSTDADEVMPPPDSNKRLDAREKTILQRWIEQGAAYQKHWSYEPPVKAAIPRDANGVDVLVARRLDAVGLKASPEADRRTLIRRLSLDLLGLPPTPADVAAFERDDSPDAYAALVERVLASPHYGERMAMGWLDVVRFADTIGYHSDNPRNVWPYRDWVIASFNANKRFDRFTLEQIAGDLLPDADRATRVGSAFNRLLLSTEEGGAQPKDYEVRMMTDRVRAIGTAWLGQTTGCAQCHDHKFDPIATRDFYALGAFFADVKESSVGRREEGMPVTTPEQDARLAELDATVRAAQGIVKSVLPEIDAAQQAWELELAASDRTLPELQPGVNATAAEKRTARDVLTAVKKSPDRRVARERQALQTYFRTRVTGLYRNERDALAAAEQTRKEYFDALPKCLVTESAREKRVVRVLPRGNWMDETGDVVQAALPHYLPQPATDGRELTRLDLARWLVSRENPLTARTVVNRLWKQFFGTGLSRVLDDLGAQGELPPNGPLLDWLACEFMDSGWDVKHVVRTIVLSRTYRQVSTATPDQLARDPENREHARQSRFRVDAELVRDNALAVAGQLSPRIGGPSVKPYQPDRYWENLNFPTRDYVPDTGESQYRRGVYVWWQRTFLHPSLLAFDAPSREECVAERNRSNLPQQALVLLNDPTYVEAARVLAVRILRDGGADTSRRLAWAWQAALQRSPRPEEAATMSALLATHAERYRADPAAARALLATGEAPVTAGVDPVEVAAWTHVARVLLNLHEFITRS
ncbi:PSD1 and planctomycete cytochrome C domain-containing protein [Horticoccus sp. 23ND18S-11]|uniref:PSD1 and planctomycete cytochrome C domain-containing protein n=1 Tax=Horticoccus sp. 23ND18S-11 TaxID=3391832 RepID=UPI0039C90D91